MGTAYTIPGTGGSAGGGYIDLFTADGKVALSVTCNYGSPGDNEALFYANSSSVTAGTVQTFVQIDGHPTAAFNDLAWGNGGQDAAFSDTQFPGTWPWHGVFTVNQGGTLTRWEISNNGSPTGDCLLLVYANNGGAASIVHP